MLIQLRTTEQLTQLISITHQITFYLGTSKYFLLIINREYQ